MKNLNQENYLKNKLLAEQFGHGGVLEGVVKVRRRGQRKRVFNHEMIESFRQT